MSSALCTAKALPHPLRIARRAPARRVDRPQWARSSKTFAMTASPASATGPPPHLEVTIRYRKARRGGGGLADTLWAHGRV